MPLLKEIYPELDFLVWFAMFAPPGTPQPIVQVERGDEQDRARAGDAAAPVPPRAHPQPRHARRARALLRKDHERLGKLVRQLNLRTE